MVAGQMLQYQGGRVRFGLPTKTYRTREDWLKDLEEQRRDGVWKRRTYYEGTQYDENNAACLLSMGQMDQGYGSEKMLARSLALWNKELPEHLRLHEYSTHILESLDFIANRLSGGFQIEVEDASAEAVIDAALDASPELSGTEDDDDLTVVGVTREALVAGDTPVLLRWDRLGENVWPEFWDSEVVDMRFRDGRADILEKVIVEEITWLVPPDQDEEKQVTIRRVWSVHPNRVVNPEIVAIGGDPVFRTECVEEVFLLNEDGKQETLIDEIGWGVPFLPWWPIRCGKKSLRSTRGESLITDQVMKSADRYNAVEQVAWLIARYNSHSNLVVAGDQALVMQHQQKSISKDVADVLTFPGATDAFALSLPTDPQMIEHQKEVLTDGMYGCMGVTRVDQSSLTGLGEVSGYALEILNQKSDGTFHRIRQQLTRDWKKLLNLILDCHAYWSQAGDLDQSDSQQVGLAAPLGEELLAEPEPTTPVPYEAIDPDVLFPNRTFTIEMGSGYIVDDVKVRDDFAANLISQEEALRKRGYGKEQIDAILKEQADANQKKLEQQQALFDTGTQEGGTRGTQGTQAPRVNSTGRNQGGGSAEQRRVSA